MEEETGFHQRSLEHYPFLYHRQLRFLVAASLSGTSRLFKPAETSLNLAHQPSQWLDKLLIPCIKFTTV